MGERAVGDPKRAQPGFEFSADDIAAGWRFAVTLAGLTDGPDLLQDALTRAWQRRESFDRSRGTLRAWLSAIIFDQRRQQLRRRGGLVFVDWSAWRAAAVRLDDCSTTQGTSETSIDVQRAVNELPTGQRKVVVLRYYVDLSVADISWILGKSEGTVKSTLSDARRSLAKTLGVGYGER